MRHACPRVVGSFYVGSDLMLNIQIEVRTGSDLDGMTAAELDNGNASLLAHTDGTNRQRSLHPPGNLQIKSGDTIVVAIAPDCLPRLEEMNTAA